MGEDTKFVVPAEGCLVRYPGTKTQLPASGASVPWTGREGTYWRRRAEEKSVIVTPSVPPKSEDKPSADASDSVRTSRRTDR
jgi:hypothetical protein